MIVEPAVMDRCSEEVPLVVLGLGTPDDVRALKLETRRKRWVQNAMGPQRSPESMVAARAMHTANHARIVARSLSSVYNCFGLAFASRRTAIVDGAQVESILADDGYKLVGQDKALRGDVVLYRDRDSNEIIHAGLISEIRTRLDDSVAERIVISQWGQDGEYEHPEVSVPTRLAGRIEYWTMRTVNA